MFSTEIKILDNFANEELTQQLEALSQRAIWQFGWKSNVAHDKYSFWHSHFAGGTATNISSCAEELLSLPQDFAILKLWERLRRNLLKEHIPLRMYGNAHTFGTEGYCHKDSECPNYFSTIYYAHSFWNPYWGGDLMFYDAEGEVLRTISAKPGRIVHFPGNISHRVSPLTKECDQLRVSFVFKTLLDREQLP